jgi:hypothetical protein
MRSLKSYGNWALVTGASAGIGMAFARALAQQGVNLGLVARRGDRLRELADELKKAHGVESRVIEQDLGRDGAAERVAEQVRDLEIGILVNNAGFSNAGRFDRVPVDRHLEMIRVNCMAVTALTHLFLPAMKTRRRGAIIIVGSVAGYQPLALAATYAATKAFDLLLGEALWAENRGTGVDVLVLSPGPVETEFQAVAGEVPHPGATPESVVEAAFAALGKKPSVIAGTLNKVRAWGIRLVPRAQTAQLAYGVMRANIPEPMR